MAETKATGASSLKPKSSLTKEEAFQEVEWLYLSNNLLQLSFEAALQSIVRFCHKHPEIDLAAVAEQLRRQDIRFFLFPALEPSDGKTFRLWCSTRPQRVAGENDASRDDWMEHRAASWSLDRDALVPGSLDWSTCQELLRRIVLEDGKSSRDQVLELVAAVKNTGRKFARVMDKATFEALQVLFHREPELARTAAESGVQFGLGETDVVLACLPRADGKTGRWNLFYSKPLPSSAKQKTTK